MRISKKSVKATLALATLVSIPFAFSIARETSKKEPASVRKNTQSDNGEGVIKGMGFIVSSRFDLNGIAFNDSENKAFIQAIRKFAKDLNPDKSVQEGFKKMEMVLTSRKEKLDAKEVPEELDQNVLDALAFFIVRQSQLAQMDMSDQEIGYFIEGIEFGASGKKEPADDMVTDFSGIESFLEERHGNQTRMNKEKAQKFLAELSKEENVEFDKDRGLYYVVLKEGKGDSPTLDDRVKVHYHGTLPDGRVFDSSRERGEPAIFPMRGVIPGFSAGLSKVKKGGKVKIYIPSELGYGDNPPPGSIIPAGGIIIFDCELIDVYKDSSASDGMADA